jgi:hypothetical protein
MAHIMVNGGAAKSIDFSSVFESLDRIRGLLGILCYSAPQTAKLISNSASVMVGATIASLFLLKHFGQTRIALRYSVVLVLAFLMISVSVVQFGLAAYGLSGIGETSRTSIAICIWFALFIFAFLRTGRFLEMPLIRPASVALTALLMAGCGVALYHQNDLWAASWRELVRTVAEAPAADIAKLPPNATIVYVGPTDIETIYYISRLPLWVALPTYHLEIALAPEEGAAGDASDELRPLIVRLASSPEKPVAIRPVVTKASYQTLLWDGQELVLALPGYWTEKFHTSLVYEWDAYRGTLRRMEPNAPFATRPEIAKLDR